MGVRAKFKCVDVADNSDSKTIRLEAVIDGSSENKEFFRWTPSGQITIGCVNEQASRQFEVGKEYYVDFTPSVQSVAPSLGQVGYEAYCKSSGGVSLVSGAKLPEWPTLSDAIRNAWDAAAESIVGFQFMGSADAV